MRMTHPIVPTRTSTRTHDKRGRQQLQSAQKTKWTADSPDVIDPRLNALRHVVPTPYHIDIMYNCSARQFCTMGDMTPPKRKNASCTSTIISIQTTPAIRCHSVVVSLLEIADTKLPPRDVHKPLKKQQETQAH